jgi:hypothetical protein
MPSCDPPLLSHLSKKICQFSFLFYFFFLLPSLTSNILNSLSPSPFTSHQVPSNHSFSDDSLTSLHHAHRSIHSSHSFRVLIGTITGFSFSIILWNLYRVIVQKYFKKIPKINDVTRLNLFLSTISATTSLSIALFGWGGMKDDYFG